MDTLVNQPTPFQTQETEQHHSARGQRNGRKGAIEQMCQTCRASGDELISIPTKLTMFSFGQVVAADRSTLVESGFDILAAIFFSKNTFFPELGTSG